ncbi:hypothetical protein L915_02876, partial [Phytophthora nicotianae]
MITSALTAAIDAATPRRKARKFIGKCAGQHKFWMQMFALPCAKR